MLLILGIAGLRFRKWWRSRVPSRKTPHLRSLSLCESPLPEKIISEKRNPLHTQTLIDFGYNFGGLPALEKAHLRKDSSSSVEEMTGRWVPQVKPKRPSLRARDSLDLIPRPFSGLLPPAPTATMQRGSRLAQFASALSSPKPSISSFEKVPPYSSRAPSPMTFSKEAPVFAAASVSSSAYAPSGALRQEANSFETKGQLPLKQKQKQKPARLLPVRVDAPHGKLPRVPAPKADAPPHVTVAGVTQKLLAASRDSAFKEQPLKSPTRMDSMRRSKRAKSTRSIVSALEVKAENPFSSPAEVEAAAVIADIGESESPTASTVESSESPTSSQSPHEHKLPRLVIVIHLYKHSMPDELPIRRGEVLRMTEEFKDGWCAVQRLSSTTDKPEVGVVPRMCISDGPTFDPSPSVSLKSRFSASTTYSHATTSTTYTKAYEPLRTPSPVPQLPS